MNNHPNSINTLRNKQRLAEASIRKGLARFGVSSVDIRGLALCELADRHKVHCDNLRVIIEKLVIVQTAHETKDRVMVIVGNDADHASLIRFFQTIKSVCQAADVKFNGADSVRSYWSFTCEAADTPVVLSLNTPNDIELTLDQILGAWW